jgi:hypothetical protein
MAALGSVGLHGIPEELARIEFQSLNVDIDYGFNSIVIPGDTKCI